jgi:hypothetical protein
MLNRHLKTNYSTFEEETIKVWLNALKYRIINQSGTCICHARVIEYGRRY